MHPIRAMTLGIALTATLWADTVQVVTSERTFARQGREIRETRYTCPLLEYDIGIVADTCLETGTSNVDWHAGPGRWIRLISYWRRGLAPGFPEHVEALRAPDGERAMVVAVIPVLSEGERRGALTFQAVQVADSPGWIFFRFSDTSRLSLDAVLMGVTLLAHSMPRQLYLGWPGGAAALGDEVPWFGARPDFNGLAWHSRGGEQDTMAEFMVFDPDDIASVAPMRWATGDDRGALRFAPVESASEWVFARGHARGAEEAARVAVPRFFQEGRDAAFKRLKRIDWELKPDWERLARTVDEVRRLVGQTDDEALKENLGRLTSEFERARNGGSALCYFGLDRRLRALNGEASAALLNRLLE